MRTIVPLEQRPVIINGVMVNLESSSPLNASYVEVDEVTLNAILQAGIKVLVLDETGGTISANKTLGWADPNVWTLTGSPVVTLPAADAYHEGLQYIFKSDGSSGTPELSAEIDGASSFAFSKNYESITVRVLNGAWAIV
jgi:hypothetical protein